MTTTSIENLCCPNCGTTVMQIIRQEGFQAGGTSIGPSSIPCSNCGTWVLTGKSEWDEKGFLQKSWFVLTRLAWIGIGCTVIGSLISSMVGWAIFEARFVQPNARLYGVIGTFALISLLIAGIMIRNMRREISDSRLRTAELAEPSASDEL